MKLKERLISIGQLDSIEFPEWKITFNDIKPIITQELLIIAEHKYWSFRLVITNAMHRIDSPPILGSFNIYTKNSFDEDIAIVNQLESWLMQEELVVRTNLERSGLFHLFYLNVKWGNL